MHRKYKKWRTSPSIFKIKNFCPVPKSPTQAGFIDVKNERLKISHLGTFKPKKVKKNIESIPIQEAEIKKRLAFKDKNKNKHYLYCSKVS
jgi:hypothetical protein